MTKRKKKERDGRLPGAVESPAVRQAVGAPHPLITPWIAIILLALTTLGFVARIHCIGRTALHNDEALQLNGIETRSFAELIQHCTHVDMHPPLSYLVQKAFRRLSSNVGFLRSASAVFGTLAIPLAFWALLPLLGVRVSLLTAALTAVSYLLIWFSRELRDYIFFYAFVLLAVGSFIRILLSEEERPPLKYLIGFGVANVFSAYSHFNTYLLWPVYGVLFAGWELLRRPAPVRWRYAVHFAVTGIVVCVLVAPTFVWFLAMRSVQGNDTFRPTPSQLYESLAPFGFGSGWRAAVFAGLLVLGIYRVLRTDRRAALVLLSWTAIPLLAYVYLLGVPAKFVTNIYRYEVFLAVGFLAILACGVEQIGIWIARKQRGAVAAVAAVCVCLVVAMMAPVYRVYYSLRSCGHLFEDVQRKLEELGPRAMLLDNYYELQYLHHYLPQAIHIAHPPVWNDRDEFIRLDVAGFIRKAAAEDPLLAFYDSNARGMSPPGTWDWLAEHYARKCEFINHEAKYLNDRGLNLFPLLFRGPEMQVIRLYYNDIEDVPAWAASHGRQRVTALGGDWHHLTLMDLNGRWIHARATDRLGSVYVFNSSSEPAKAKLSLELHGCSSTQQVTIRRGGETPVASMRLTHSRPDGVDLRSQQRFTQYIPFGAVLRKQGGVLNLPVAVHLPFDTISTPELLLAPGLNTFAIGCSAPDGIVLEGVRCE